MKKVKIKIVFVMLFLLQLTLLASSLQLLERLWLNFELQDITNFENSEINYLLDPNIRNENITSMFNERGYYNSNSFSTDENEIINDFSGNLLLSFPMFQFKGQGETDFNLSLNYNGSLGYQTFVSNKSDAYTHTLLSTLNVSSPGWIFSVNGIGVQMVNFQRKWLSEGTTEIKNNNVSLLATGYHINNIRQDIASNRDEIMILMGDGSVLSLENLVVGENIGDYYSNSTANYTRANVEFRYQDIDTVYLFANLRKMNLYLGDGLEYYFEEDFDSYEDYNDNTFGYFNKPKSFYLKYIVDSFGNMIYFNYGIFPNQYPHVGRKILREIFFSWSPEGSANLMFNYNTGGIIDIVNPVYGRFRVTTSNYSEINRPDVQSIQDLVNRTTTISNVGYERSISNVRYGTISNSTRVQVKLESSSLKRVGSFINYTGGSRSYSYFSPNNLSYELPDVDPEGAYYFQAGDPQNYKGQGRDPFYTNMLSSVSYKIDNNEYKKLDLNYSYVYKGGLASYNLDPVSQSDHYGTEMIYSKPSGIPASITPSYFRVDKEYKIYQLYGLAKVAGFDYAGEIKLVKEKHFKENVQFKEVYNEYEKVINHISSSGDTTYKGSFLNTKVEVTELPSNATSKSEFAYQYFHDFPHTDSFKNPVKSVLTIDQLGNKSFVTNKAFLETALYYSGAHYLGPVYQAELEMLYYKINLPQIIETRDDKDNVLSKSENIYILDNTNDKGYMGQLNATKTFMAPNFNTFIENKIEYYKEDSLGLYLYNNDYQILPPKEGNVKLIFDPNDNVKTFYYHPINRNEEFSHGTPVFSDFQGIIGEDEIEYEVDNQWSQPKISYYIMDESYNATLVNSLFRDRRMPTRVDNAVNPNYSLVNYNSYELNGNISKSISQNSFVQNYEFDKLSRVTAVVLPYDFNNSQAYDSIDYDTIYTPVEGIFKANHAGIKLQSNEVTWDGNVDYVNLVYNYSQNSGIQYSYPLLTFPVENLIKDSTEYAYLRFYPSYFKNTSPLIIEMNPITSYSLSNPKSATIGHNSIVIDTLYTWDSIRNCTQIRNNMPAFFQHRDIRDLISTNFKGIAFTVDNAAAVELDNPEFIFESRIYIGYCLQGYLNHWNTYVPRLDIRSLKRSIIMKVIRVFPRTSLKYSYDDAKNSVEIKSKIDNTSTTTQRDKKSQHYFDGFNRLTKSKLFTTTSAFDSLQFEYNYLDLKSKSIDAKNNGTQFFYDAYLNVSQTKFASNDSSLLNNSYSNSFSNYFGTIDDFINIQEFVDENGKSFYKYFDAVGNLRREVKYTEFSENDPQSDNPLENLIPMYTDYDYDDLYRLIAVRTPNGKNITYSYDGYGRVSQRNTPDAGITKYKYDKNSNLTYSQDQNQINEGSNFWTFRDYDGLNRMTGLGTASGGSLPAWDNLDGEEQYQSDNPNDPYEDHLLINIYDTTANAPSEIFTSPLNYGTNNLTKGNLVATAHRTTKQDPWNFKYYRYDARGRIIKMWQKINGLPDWKEVNYSFNSSDMVTYLNYQPTKYDSKLYEYFYDDAARLNNVKVYTGGIAPEDPGIESPWLFESFVSYGYNQNSQINSQQFSTITSSEFAYNNRNWLTDYDNDIDLLDYNLTYFANGNIETQELTGDYTNWLNDKTQLVYEYKYDKSNRLLRADQLNSSGFSVWNSYDKDGNILTLKRHDVGGSLEDNFSYQYITNTNKLKRVSGSVDQFFYDGNGNMIADSLNGTYNISYDHRNLIVQLYYKRYVDENLRLVLRTFSEFYKYDDAGNRIKKVVMKYTGTSQNPEVEDSGDAPPNWNYELIQHYVRDIGGNELAVYNDTTATFWNVYGIDNVGKINYSDNSWNYYLKDHLGSPRVVLDQNGDIISAEDLDMWGYRMDQRSFDSDSSFYRFTGMERDVTTGYDYFGARYYISHIGRWNGVDIMYDKNLSLSPFQYGLLNPLKFIDPNGEEEIEVIVRTFIPFQYIMGGIHGDNRGNSTNLDASSRTTQSINVELDSRVSPGIIQSGPENELSPTKFTNFFLFGLLLGTTFEGKGSGDFYTRAERFDYEDAGQNVTLILEATAEPGLFPISPSIDYQFQVDITIDSKGEISANVKGNHNKFPAYEILVKRADGTVQHIYKSSLPKDPIIGPFYLFDKTGKNNAY